MAETAVYMDEVDVDSVGGFDRVQPGAFFAKIVGVDEESDQKGKMIVDFEILSGTIPGQEGKIHREWFDKSNQKMAIRKLTALAIACGLTTVDQLKKLKSEGKPFSADYQKCNGKLVCLLLEENDYNGKISTRLSWDSIYLPLDKRAAHIPLHAGMLKQAGIELPANRPLGGVRAAAATSASGQSQPNKKTESAPVVSADDLLAGVV